MWRWRAAARTCRQVRQLLQRCSYFFRILFTQLPMRVRKWIILRPPEAGWMVLTADFRHVAVPTILSRLDKKPPVLNASGEVGNRVSNFFADFAGKPLRVETCGDQRSIGPARGNIVKAGLDFRRKGLNLFWRRQSFSKQEIKRWLQFLTAQRRAVKVLVFSGRTCSEFKFVIYHPQTIFRLVAVDAIHAAANGQPIHRLGPIRPQLVFGIDLDGNRKVS